MYISNFLLYLPYIVFKNNSCAYFFIVNFPSIYIRPKLFKNEYKGSCSKGLCEFCPLEAEELFLFINHVYVS